MKIVFVFMLLVTIVFAFNNKILVIENAEDNKTKVLHVKCVSHYKDRVKGLSGIKSLEWNEGMLFQFQEEQRRSIWMKDMLISLDIIFLSRDKKVRLFLENIQPCKSDNCEIYTAQDTQYIIEVRAGYIKKNKLTLNSFFQIKDETSKNN